MNDMLDISTSFAGFGEMVRNTSMPTMQGGVLTSANLDGLINSLQLAQDSEPEPIFYVSLKMHKRLYILTALASQFPHPTTSPRGIRNCVFRRFIKRRQKARRHLERAYEKRYAYAK